MIADIISNKTLNQMVSELFIGGRKLNISTAFITRSYFAVPRDVRPSCTIICCNNLRQKRASTNPI